MSESQHTTMPLESCSHQYSLWARWLAIAVTAIVAVLPSPEARADERVALTFLQIQPDARARGMGEAAVGLTEIASPYATNPGALALQGHTTLYAGAGEWLPEYNLDLTYYCAGLSARIADFGAVAFSVRMFSYGEIIRTTELGQIDQYHSFDLAVGGSVGFAPHPNLTVGSTVSLLYSKFADQGAIHEFEPRTGATSVAFDLGLLIHDIAPRATITTPSESHTGDDPVHSSVNRRRLPHTRGFAIGLALHNIGPDITSIDPRQSIPLPRNIAIGVSYRPVDLDGFGMVLSTEVDGSLVDDGTDFPDRLVLNLGAEVTLYSLVSARVGRFENPDSGKGVTTLGLGLGFERFQINVSYIPKIDQPLSKTWFMAVNARL